MQKTNRYILSTRPLPKDVAIAAASQNIIIEELSFIITNPIETEEIIRRIQVLATKKCTVVFTSMNAVEAVAKQMENADNWNVYSTGNTTKKLIEEKLPLAKIIATAENAQRLGERMIDDGVKDIVFFCGNIRRDELPNKFRSEGGTVEEVVVYETVEKSPLLNKEYDGILFFSPSAVNSFFKDNKVPRQTELFAIGKTTAETLRQFANKKIIVGNAADKKELAKQAIAYFSNQKT